MAEWFARYPNDNGEYEITFKSWKYKEAKLVEKVCHAIVDEDVKNEDDIGLLIKEKLTEDKLIEALNSVTWYNGYYEDLLKVREEIAKKEMRSPYDNYRTELTWENEGFQVIWMILVLLFGDYGTSPRSGWVNLKNREEILEFIDRICATAIEHELGVKAGLFLE